MQLCDKKNSESQKEKLRHETYLVDALTEVIVDTLGI